MAGTIRIGSRGNTRPIMMVDYTFDLFPRPRTLVCYPAPNGTCREGFPQLKGPAVVLGVQRAFRWGLSAAAGAGVGSYGGWTAIAQASASWLPTQHIGAVVDVRYHDVPAQGRRAWVRPVTFGLRVAW